MLDRYYQAARHHGVDIVVRIASDCPLLDPGLADEVVRPARSGLARGLFSQHAPSNVSADWTSRRCRLPPLNRQRSGGEARSVHERAHVFPYVYEHPDKFSMTGLTDTVDRSDALDRRHWRRSEFVREVYEARLARRIHMEGRAAGAWRETRTAADQHAGAPEIRARFVSGRLAIVFCVHHKPWLMMSTLLTLVSQPRQDADCFFLYNIGNGESSRETYAEYRGLAAREGVNTQLSPFDERVREVCQLRGWNVFEIEYENDHCLDSGCWYKFIRDERWRTKSRAVRGQKDVVRHPRAACAHGVC